MSPSETGATAASGDNDCMPPPAICRPGEACARLPLGDAPNGPAINLMASAHATLTLRALAPTGEAAGVEAALFTAELRDIWLALGLAPTVGVTAPLPGGGLRLRIGGEVPVVFNTHGGRVPVVPVFTAGATISTSGVTPYFSFGLELPMLRTDGGTLTIAPAVTADQGPGFQLSIGFRMGRFWDDAFSGHLFGQ